MLLCPALLVALALALAGPSGAAEPLDGPALAEHLASIADLLAGRRGGPIPALDDADHARLAGGGTVIKTEQEEGSALRRATVLRVIDIEPWRIWLALSDVEHHEEFMPYVREGTVLADLGESRLVYQYMALPAIKDRQWVIRGHENGVLWLLSGKTIWESTFQLEPDGRVMIDEHLQQGTIEGVTPEEAESAIITPKNEGYWLLVELPDGRCFVAYQSLTDMGGKIPSWLVNEIGPAGLKTMVQKIEQHGRQIEQFFSADNPPPAAPDGSEVEQLSLSREGR